MGGPLYQRNHQSSERCRRRPCQPLICGSMEIRLQRMYGIPRRFTFGSLDFNQIGKESRTSSLQTAYGSGDTPKSTGSWRGPFPEQQRKVGGLRRTAGRTSLRDIHRFAGWRWRYLAAEERDYRTYHQECRRRRNQALWLPVRKQTRI